MTYETRIKMAEEKINAKKLWLDFCKAHKETKYLVGRRADFSSLVWDLDKTEGMNRTYMSETVKTIEYVKTYMNANPGLPVKWYDMRDFFSRS